MNPQLPTMMETTLGVFLHDIGKLLQRALGGDRRLSPATAALETNLLPFNPKGGYHSHKHVLWTEEFFDWVKRKGAESRLGINWQRVRTVAVYHHKPEAAVSEIGALGWLAAEADRLASGMDRKPKDEEDEAAAERGARDRYVRTAQVSPFSGVQIGRGNPPKVFIPLGELRPGPEILPSGALDTSDYRERYQRLWQSMERDLEAALGMDNAELLCEALLSISERYLFAVPSSTIDEPDVSLHDHARAAAAIAAAMYRWHEREGTLADEAAIKDRKKKKYRFLAGDLSGIQHSLFLLASQRVRGSNRILRARSFLFTAITEAAALLARRAFGLPAFGVVQNAGGRFVILAPATPDCPEIVDGLRREIDRWLLERYFGELSLNIALGEPFAGEAFSRERIGEPLRQLSQAIDEAKLRAFGSAYRPVHRGAMFREGPCQACGRRPDEHVEKLEDGGELRLCRACADEERLGRDLPKISYLIWRQLDGAGPRALPLFGGVRLEWSESQPQTGRALSAVRLFRGSRTAPGPFALRFLANYVPVLTEKDLKDPRHAAVAREDEKETFRAGDIKTFEHIAATGLRPENGAWVGQPLLAVLKADVDWLGFIFGRGMQRRSLSRVAALSRMMDFFFTGQLHHILEQKFPDHIREQSFPETYTVYAGGDDLLLIGPWEAMLKLASEIRRQFGLWAGGNPNLTLSAGVELMKVGHPVNRAALAADDRLKCAKKSRGKDQICSIAPEPVGWQELERQLKHADTLAEYLQKGWLSQIFVYRLLAFDEQRRKAESPQGQDGKTITLDLEAAGWRAKWGYQLARNVRDAKAVPDQEKDRICKFLNGLLGLDAGLRRQRGEEPSPRIAVSVALYRSRKYTERS